MSHSAFSRITLIAVTGVSDAQSAAYALTLSQRNMPGARAVLCCPHAPADLPASIRHEAIAPMSYIEYSWFMMFVLWHFVETDYALVVQDDGWVLDGANWRDEYFEYDYVGAPVHLARVHSPEGTRWMDEFSWLPFLDKPGHSVLPILNGGFSLRSRRMMQTLFTHPEIQVVVVPPDGYLTDPFKPFWVADPTNEDVQLTCLLRPQLEAVGIRFAPLDLCTQFAMEDSGSLHVGADLSRLFGHHGKWRRLVGIDPPTVHYPSPRSTVASALREMDFAQMLVQRGYRVGFAPEPT